MWHDITSLGLHTLSDDVGRGLTSPPLDSTHDRTTSGVACHHRLWVAQMVERRRAWHDITALGLHTLLDNVGRGMPSSPFDRTHNRTTSDVACHHRLWVAKIVEQRRAWHDITALGLHTWLDNVGRSMPSSPLDSTHDRMTSGVVCHHRPWVAQMVERRRALHDITALGLHTRSDNVKRGMPSLPLGRTHDRTTSGVACHHRLWVAQMVE